MTILEGGILSSTLGSGEGLGEGEGQAEGLGSGGGVGSKVGVGLGELDLAMKNNH
ncbi:MAG: hypothetical protein NW237_08115 [Cyanobacteriota bacterium]|nr:hypothetical protein [Cyanobacteriota bacterium]